MKQSIEYNGKTIKLPFHIPGDMLKVDECYAENHISGESITLPRFAKSVRDGILYYEWNANEEDKRLGWGGSELWNNVRSGLNWFRQHFAKEYMVLLD
jgi:hypothetical protein